MEKFALGILIFAAMIFFVPLLGVLAGAFSGWVVGFFWSDPILDFLARLGVNTRGLTVWEIGAAMGFLGGFLKTNSTGSSSKAETEIHGSSGTAVGTSLDLSHSRSK